MLLLFLTWSQNDTLAFRQAAQDDEMDILNYSAGMQTPQTGPVPSPLDAAPELGPNTIVVVAAGNQASSGQWTVGYPAAYRTALSVANLKSYYLVGAYIKLNRNITVNGETTDVIGELQGAAL